VIDRTVKAQNPSKPNPGAVSIALAASSVKLDSSAKPRAVNSNGMPQKTGATTIPQKTATKVGQNTPSNPSKGLQLGSQPTKASSTPGKPQTVPAKPATTPTTASQKSTQISPAPRLQPLSVQSNAAILPAGSSPSKASPIKKTPLPATAKSPAATLASPPKVNPWTKMASQVPQTQQAPTFSTLQKEGDKVAPWELPRSGNPNGAASQQFGGPLHQQPHSPSRPIAPSQGGEVTATAPSFRSPFQTGGSGQGEQDPFYYPAPTNRTQASPGASWGLPLPAFQQTQRSSYARDEDDDDLNELPHIPFHFATDLRNGHDDGGAEQAHLKTQRIQQQQQQQQPFFFSNSFFGGEGTLSGTSHSWEILG